MRRHHKATKILCTLTLPNDSDHECGGAEFGRALTWAFERKEGGSQAHLTRRRGQVTKSLGVDQRAWTQTSALTPSRLDT